MVSDNIRTKVFSDFMNTSPSEQRNGKVSQAMNHGSVTAITVACAQFLRMSVSDFRNSVYRKG